MSRLPQIPPVALGPILLVSLLVLLVFQHATTPDPAIAPPWAITNNFTAPEPASVPGEPTPSPEPLSGTFLQRADLDIISADGLFSSEDQSRLAADLERALNYVSGRFGSSATGRINAYVGLAAGCGLHGIAYTDQRLVQVFTCADLPRSRAVNIMAHEFVHQLAHDRYGPQHLQADMILLEGIATWGAGEYWLDGQPSFTAFIRPYKQNDQLLPLATSYVGRSLNDMNLLYYQWASFVDFLIAVYGRETFDALYITGSHAPGSADYVRLYGKGLAELEQEWLNWIDQ
jgi:hypothetical protein